MWGQAAVGTTLWAEDFSGYSANGVPSGSITNNHTGTTVYGGATLAYSCANGTTNTKIYTDNVPTGGSGSNLLISKSNGSFSVSGIPTGSATELTLSYAKGGKGTLSVSSSTNNVSISGSTITTGGAATIDLVFTNTASGDNLRLDNISVKVKTAGASKTNTTLALNPTSLNLSYGGSNGTLTATVTPEGGSALANPTVTWKSDDESVATVSGGTVTPVGEGTTTITATYAGDTNYNGSSNTATVTVTDNRTAVVSAIESINSIKSLYIGGKHAFTPVVTLADGLSASDVTYSYVSADPTTIQINDDGTYTALKTGTNIDITVTATPVAAKAATHKPVSATFQHNGAYKYSKPIFTPTGVTEGNFSGSMTLAIANDGTPTGPIYYTLDGEEPATDKSNGTLYESALTLTATKTVKARVIDDDGYYSTVTSATYTKVAAQKDAITLAAGQTLSFTNFSDVSTSYGDTENYLIASDGDKYKWSGSNYCRQSSDLQLKDNASANITSSPITSTNGFKMTVTTTQNSVKVYVGETEKSAVNGVYYFSSGDAVTLKRNGGTTKVSNITFTGLKPSRSVTFPDGNQTITVGGATITKTATVSPAGTATYSSSDATIATVNETTGEVTAVKGGEVTITATVAADDDYEESKGTYKVTVNKGATTLAFDNAEETVELVDGTATYTATISPADGRTITYSSDDITVNSSTGEVTLTATGDYVIKANANATDKYLAPSEASYTLHVVDSREPIVNAATLNLELTDVLDDPIALNGVVKGDEGFLAATYTTAAGFSGTEVVSFATSDATVLKIENGNEFYALKGGTAKVTVTVTSGGNNLFTDVEKEFTVTVTNNSKTATEIEVMDEDTNIYEDGDVFVLTMGTPMILDISATNGYEGTITTTLGNDQIISVNVEGSSYTITPLAVGSTTLTLSAGETANYAAASNVVLNFTVKGLAELSYATASFTVPYGADFPTPTLTNPHNLPITYAKSGDDVVTVDPSTGAVTILSGTEGTARITASTLGNEDYDSGSAYYDIVVCDPTVKGSQWNPFTVDEANAWIAANLSNNETTTDNYYVRGIVSSLYEANKSGGTQYFFMSDDGSTSDEIGVYYTLNIGGEKFNANTWVHVGDQVVVCGPLNNYYNSGNNYPYIETGAELTACKYNSVDVPLEASFSSDFGAFLFDGEKYNLTDIWNIGTYSGTSYAKATSYISNSNRNAESWLISPMIDAQNVATVQLSFDQAINNHFGTIANEAMVYAKKEGASDWTKMTISEYPAAPSSGYSSFLTSTVNLNDYAGEKFQIAFVYIGSTAAAGTWEIKDVKVSASVPVTLGTNGYTTFASSYALDLTNLPEGVTAYKAAVEGTTVNFTALDQAVPANTGVLLKGEAGATVNISVASSGETVTGNAFLVNTAGTTFDADADYYYFGLLKNTLTFAQFNPSSVAIPANKAYLKVLKSSIDGSATKSLNVTFDDGESTAIEDVFGSTKEQIEGGNIYDLQGRKVVKPTHGLYIVNGKKVFIK